ncbi:hypothetical protein N431DRAFT_535429 [Stipitochalara longipes BDJ]|nr:hypothetical protein N431DRAFT_535429 [Stipitochalara longipes BDJ]
MPETTFWVNTAMMCYHCQRVAIVKMRQSWRQVKQVGIESEVLDVVFVVCAVCLTLPNAHQPYISLRRYVDPRAYSRGINILAHIFNCTANIQQERKFSITALRVKKLAKIRDITEIFYVPAVPDNNIIILKEGLEITTDCRFFFHEPIFTRRNAAGYRTNNVFATFEKRSEGLPHLSNTPRGANLSEPPPPYQELEDPQ